MIFCRMRLGGASRYRRKRGLVWRLMDRRSFRISGICTSETVANKRVRSNSLALINANGLKFKERDRTSVFAMNGLSAGEISGRGARGRRCMQILLSIWWTKAYLRVATYCRLHWDSSDQKQLSSVSYLPRPRGSSSRAVVFIRFQRFNIDEKAWVLDVKSKRQIV